MTGILLAGCQKAPTDQLATTQTALEQARAAEADKYAPDAFSKAQTSFSGAADEITAQDQAFFLTRDYSKANQLLTDALAELQTAQTEAVANKETAKQEVETLTTETEAAIQAAQTALLKAPRGKDTKAEIEAMKADLDATSAALAEARDMYSRGDYLGAKASLTQSKGKAEAVSSEVETAMQKVRGARRPAGR